MLEKELERHFTFCFIAKCFKYPVAAKLNLNALFVVNFLRHINFLISSAIS